ncbi:MAG: ArsA family ATPase [Pleurocapsa sp.]
MSSIVTFLGKGGTGRTTLAIATAKKLAAEGKKVLLFGQDSGPSLSIALGVIVTPEPQSIEPNLSVAQLSATTELEKNWEEVKKIEAEYLRSPILKQVYGQELGVLPGMDAALALNVLREYYQSDGYEVIVYDGSGNMETLRMLGMPEILSWYFRRFKGIFTESEIVKTLSPFVQPVSSAILNVSWTPDDLRPNANNRANQILKQGIEAIESGRVIAYLVTTADQAAIATAKYLWGSAQQVGLTVAGVFLNQSSVTDELAAEFNPLTVTSIPQVDGNHWQSARDDLPDLNQRAEAPKPTAIKTTEGKIKIFLPGFAKKEVKLTQYGPEITVEAGDQRRNITLPPNWRGSSVTGAKFQNGYLEITIG